LYYETVIFVFKNFLPTSYFLLPNRAANLRQNCEFSSAL